MKVFVGTISDFAGNNNSVENILAAKNAENPAYEWVECLGQSLLASDHPIVATILGTFNDGGVLKIQVPDLRGKVTAGIGSYTDSNGDSGLISPSVYGTYNHTLTEEEMPEHSHENGASEGTVFVRASGTGSVSYADSQTGTTGGGQAHNNMQPTMGTYKLMLLDKAV